MTDASEGTRVKGVEFGALKRALLEQEYPVTAAELVEQYGAFELEHPAGPERLEDVLNRVDHAKFREPWEVRDAVLEGVDHEPAEPKADGEGDGAEAAGGDSLDTGDWTRT